MKNLLILSVLTLLCGCTDKFGGYSEGDFTGSATPNITIDTLRTFYLQGGRTTFLRDYTISGIVTANDESGNFYRTLIIEDSSGALEIKAGTYDLHTLYPVGREIFVHLTGLTYGQYDGMPQLGLKGLASSGYEVDYLQHNSIIDRYITRGGMKAEFTPPVITIPQINSSMTGKLVTIEGLTLEGGGELTWAIPGSESYNGQPQSRDIKAFTENSDVIYIYTSGYASFASEPAPSGKISVTGIILKHGNAFRLKIRDLDDVR